MLPQRGLAWWMNGYETVEGGFYRYRGQYGSEAEANETVAVAAAMAAAMVTWTLTWRLRARGKKEGARTVHPNPAGTVYTSRYICVITHDSQSLASPSSKGFTKNTVVVYDVTGDGDTGKRPIIVFPRDQRKCRAVRA